MLQTMHQKGQKGFTLVELMIVVAIIGILAAIAIPQFAQYRIRGFNSSAMSDIRNLNTSQAAFYTDWNQYGFTIDDDTKLAGDAQRAGDSLVTAIADVSLAGVLHGGESPATLIGAYIRGGARPQVIVVGSNVQIVAHSSNNVNAGAGVAFVAAAKHYQGDSTYAVDSDSPTMYRSDLRGPGVMLPHDDITLAADQTTGDDFRDANNAVVAPWVAL